MRRLGTVRDATYPRALTDEQWALLERVVNAPEKRDRKHPDELRSVVDAMLHVAQTGCRWHCPPDLA